MMSKLTDVLLATSYCRMLEGLEGSIYYKVHVAPTARTVTILFLIGQANTRIPYCRVRGHGWRGN